MKASEIITERISIVKHQRELEKILREVVKESIKDLMAMKRKLQHKKAEVDNPETVSLDPIADTLREELRHSLIFHTKDKVEDFSLNILPIKAYIPVDIKPLNNALGQAHGMNVELDDKWFGTASVRIYDDLYQMALDWYDNNSLYDTFFHVITQPQCVNEAIDTISHRLEELAGTILHEFVHSMQAYGVFNQNKGEYARNSYDSYKSISKRKHPASKESEFVQLARRRDELIGDEKTRYNELYLASPQEIEAFAHNAAQKTMSALGLTGTFHSSGDDDVNIEAYENGEMNDEIRNYLEAYVQQVFRKNAPGDEKIYNRYLNIAYRATIDAIDHFVAQQKKEHPYKRRGPIKQRLPK
jgi:hypothetical protein